MKQRHHQASDAAGDHLVRGPGGVGCGQQPTNRPGRAPAPPSWRRESSPPCRPRSSPSPVWVSAGWTYQIHQVRAPHHSPVCWRAFQSRRSPSDLDCVSGPAPTSHHRSITQWGGQVLHGCLRARQGAYRGGSDRRCDRLLAARETANDDPTTTDPLKARNHLAAPCGGRSWPPQ